MVLSMKITVTFLTSISIDFWGQLYREFLENWCSANYYDSTGTCINFQIKREHFEKKFPNTYTTKKIYEVQTIKEPTQSKKQLLLLSNFLYFSVPILNINVYCLQTQWNIVTVSFHLKHGRHQFIYSISHTC